MKATNLQWLTARDTLWGAPLWARGLLVVAALSLIALRFESRDLVPYILDEPHFQDAASTHVQDGTWPKISPLTGNLGVAYGPAPVWFYIAVHHLVGPRPERSVMAATLFLSLADLLLAAALACSLRGGWLLFATAAALLAGSPFLFFWSRVGWEVLAGYVALTVALLASGRTVGLIRGMLIGVCLGLGLSSHPMTVPFALATLAVLGWEAARRRSGAGSLAATLVFLVLVNLPYLEALHAATRAPAPPGPSLGVRLLSMPARIGAELVEPARVITTNGVSYFFDDAWSDFLAWLGPARALLVLGPIVTIVLSVLAASGLLWAARYGPQGARRIARVGLLAWIGLALLLSAIGIPVHPHYQLAAYWLMPAGVMALAVALQRRHPNLGRGLLAGVWVFAAAEASFNEAWMRWVRERGGTAGIHYSVPMAGQRTLLRAVCSTSGQLVALRNQTYLFPDSLLSLARTEPACYGKRLMVCPGTCPPVDASWRQVLVRYAAYPGGRLALYAQQ